MGDPERLLKSGAADPQVRELLQSLRGIAPEANMGVSSWGVMAAKVATLPTVVPAPGSAPAAPAAPAAPGALAGGIAGGVSQVIGLKLLAVAVASTVLGVGVYWVHAANQRPNRAAGTVAPTAVARLAASQQAAEPSSDQAALDLDATPVQSDGNPSPASATRISRLDAEASMLAKAHSLLRSGDSHAALLTLNQLQSTFPRGALTQERDVLWVEVLAASGNTAAAKRKAAAFIAAHPRSPHSAKLERFVEAP